MAAHWATISALGTAAGTLVLAVATFASVRSANRSARATERALLAGTRPVLVSSRLQDPPEKVGFADDHWVKVDGGHAVAEATTTRSTSPSASATSALDWPSSTGGTSTPTACSTTRTAP